MKKTKLISKNKFFCIIMGALMALTLFSGCGDEGFNAEKDVVIFSREAGSGTRSAFVELFDVMEKNADGKKIDKTVMTANINDSTGIMLTNIASNKYGIGYVSLGALNDSVKALQIDGASATAKNIADGSYAIARPFNIAVNENVSEIAQDFIDFILSAEGQQVVEETGYIAINDFSDYKGGNIEGKIVVAGSSSVTPVMEKLKEAYLKINEKAEIEIQQTDSTSGMTAAIEGICDIGMASRDLKESEIEKGLTPIEIAIDGIAVIVNPENPLTNLSKSQVKTIFTGEITKWSELQ